MYRYDKAPIENRELCVSRGSKRGGIAMRWSKKKSKNSEETDSIGTSEVGVPHKPVGSVTGTGASGSHPPVLSGAGPALGSAARAPSNSSGDALSAGSGGLSADVLTQRYGKARSALSQETTINGRLSFDTPVRIDGKLSGEVSSSALLVIGATAVVEANVQAAKLVIAGTLRGSATATERVELLAGARLEGQVISPIFVLEEGAMFEGSCLTAPAERIPRGLAGSVSISPESPMQPPTPQPRSEAASQSQEELPLPESVITSAAGSTNSAGNTKANSTKLMLESAAPSALDTIQ